MILASRSVLFAGLFAGTLLPSLGCPSAPSSSTPSPGASSLGASATSQAIAPAEPMAPSVSASSAASVGAPLADGASPDVATAPTSTTDAASLANLADRSNALGLEIYAAARRGHPNLALSPLSISMALAMTWAGARGETATQMKSVLPDQIPREIS